MKIFNGFQVKKVGGKMLLKNKVSIINITDQGIEKVITNLFAKECSDVILTNIDIKKVEKITAEIKSNTNRELI